MRSTNARDPLFGLRFLKVAADTSTRSCHRQMVPVGRTSTSGVNVALERRTFVKKQANEEGPAALSLGVADNISDVIFDSNTRYCSSGTYGYDMDALDPKVRDTVALTDPTTCLAEKMP